MICADTNVWIAYFAGRAGPEIDIMDNCLLRQTLVMSPVVMAELLSDPTLDKAFERLLFLLPQIPITPDFWWRSGKLRAKLIQIRLKPKLADTLIAQLCIDHDMSFLSLDRDFRALVR